MYQKGKHTVSELWLFSIITAAVALVFLVAAYHMVMDWGGHRQHMRDQVFSKYWTDAMVWILPIGYSLIGVALSYRPLRPTALWVALGYVVLLTTYIILAMNKAFGFYPCSCIGFLSERSFQANLRFNRKLIGVILLAITLERRWLIEIWIYLSGRWEKRRKEVARSGG